MQTGRRYRLYPSGEQSKILARWIGCVRFLYNQKVEEDTYLMWLRHWAIFSPSYTGPEGPEPEAGIVNQRCAHLKTDSDKDWLWETPAVLYRNAMSQYRQAWANRFKNPAHYGRPSKRTKGVSDSILITRELFTIENDSVVFKGKKSPGSIFFQKHRACGTPNQITISQDIAGDWWLSFTFEDGITPIDQKEILAEVRAHPTPRSLIEGFDRGVKNPVWGSKTGDIQVPEITQTRLEKWQERQAKLQRRLALKTPGSKNRKAVRRKLARNFLKLKNSRENFAHQVSNQIMRNSPARILVFEDLKLRNMTRAPAPKQNGSGRYLPNGATAKAGLNRALLGNVLGRILLLVSYKAPRHGKAVVLVNPAHSSQECSACGFTHRDNRIAGQFHCLRCDSTKHADANASETLEHRGLHTVLSPPLESNGVTAP